MDGMEHAHMLCTYITHHGYTFYTFNHIHKRAYNCIKARPTHLEKGYFPIIK